VAGKAQGKGRNRPRHLGGYAQDLSPRLGLGLRLRARWGLGKDPMAEVAGFVGERFVTIGAFDPDFNQSVPGCAVERRTQTGSQ